MSVMVVTLEAESVAVLRTTPALGAAIGCSIFMASSTNTTSPCSTRSPSLTSIAAILPGIGDMTAPLPPAAAPAAKSSTSTVMSA